jgi:ADP-heptose:LPS heptosyltransferase
LKDPGGHIEYQPIPKDTKVKRILAIRLQASGDVVISLPYLQSLRDQLPAGVELDFLVREECKGIAEQFSIFNKVYVLKGGRNPKLQLLHFLFLFPVLFFRRYDVLLDLQNHRLSRIMRKLLRIKAFTVFDRTSSNYAGDRYKNTINILELPSVKFEVLRSFKNKDTDAVLKKFGLKRDINYIVINPAGAFPTRNLDMQKYLDLCRLWQEQEDPHVVFLLIGLSAIKEKAAWLKNKLGNSVIDLVNKTTQIEALCLLKHAQLTVSEDSGLLHMSYCAGTPSVGILGSTRNDWTNPQLPHTYFFHSSDLPCGNCLLAQCPYAGIPCLSRITAQMILNAARDLKDLRDS